MGLVWRETMTKKWVHKINDCLIVNAGSFYYYIIRFTRLYGALRRRVFVSRFWAYIVKIRRRHQWKHHSSLNIFQYSTLKERFRHRRLPYQKCLVGIFEGLKKTGGEDMWRGTGYTICCHCYPKQRILTDEWERTQSTIVLKRHISCAPPCLPSIFLISFSSPFLRIRTRRTEHLVSSSNHLLFGYSVYNLF